MAEKDITQKKLEMYNDVFADIINVLIFKGKEVIKPDALEETETVTQYAAEGTSHEQYRDVAKLWKEGNIRLAFFGLENQTKPDKDMPLRVIGYDGAAYRGQLLHKNKSDKRYPVITIVLYFGYEPWTKNKTLLECFDKIPEELQSDIEPFINDYKLNIIQVCDIPRETIAKFKSDFRHVAEYFWQIKHIKDYQPEDVEVQHIEAILELLAEFGGETILLERYRRVKRKKGKVRKVSDVMKGILSKKLLEGEAKGLAEGEAKGLAEGEARGEIKGRCEDIKRIMQKLKMSIDGAMEFLEIPLADRPAILAAL